MGGGRFDSASHVFHILQSSRNRSVSSISTLNYVERTCQQMNNVKFAQDENIRSPTHLLTRFMPVPLLYDGVQIIRD